MNHSDGSCAICAYAEDYGSWPPEHKGTHCSHCHASWTGLVMAHCVVCHQTFASNGTADLHWSGERHIDPGLVCNADGTPKLKRYDDGVWHLVVTKPRPAHWKRAG